MKLVSSVSVATMVFSSVAEGRMSFKLSGDAAVRVHVWIGEKLPLPFWMSVVTAAMSVVSNSWFSESKLHENYFEPIARVNLWLFRYSSIYRQLSMLNIPFEKRNSFEKIQAYTPAVEKSLLEMTQN